VHFDRHTNRPSAMKCLECHSIKKSLQIVFFAIRVFGVIKTRQKRIRQFAELRPGVHCTRPLQVYRHFSSQIDYTRIGGSLQYPRGRRDFGGWFWERITKNRARFIRVGCMFLCKLICHKTGEEISGFGHMWRASGGETAN